MYIGGIGGILIGGIIIAPGKWKEDLQKEDVENTFKVNGNYLKYERKKAETTILSVPVKTVKWGSGAKPKVLKVEYRKVRVPSGPTCGDLANAVQQSYDNSYNQGQEPVRVQFYGTDNYYSFPLKLIESDKKDENNKETANLAPIVNIGVRDDVVGTGSTLSPTSIYCEMMNASFVEYGPAGNKHCNDLMVGYRFDENRFWYREIYSSNCKASYR